MHLNEWIIDRELTTKYYFTYLIQSIKACCCQLEICQPWHKRNLISCSRTFNIGDHILYNSNGAGIS